MMVGEVNLTKTELIAPYLGDGDELHLAFDFESLAVPWEAGAWRARIAHVEEVMGERWPTWVFSNHDQPRMRTRLGGSEAARPRRRALLLTLRGTPFLYAGEELGLEDADVPPERVVDPGGRDGCRAPIPWTAAPDHGWPADPWLPWPPEPGARSVEAQRADPDSVLHLARAVLALRRDSPALHRGTLELLDDAPDGVLAYERAPVTTAVACGSASPARPAALPEGWVVELATADTGDGLPPDAAAALRPRDARPRRRHGRPPGYPALIVPLPVTVRVTCGGLPPYVTVPRPESLAVRLWVAVSTMVPSPASAAFASRATSPPASRSPPLIVTWSFVVVPVTSMLPAPGSARSGPGCGCRSPRCSRAPGA